jgi:5'-nucleotidase
MPRSHSKTLLCLLGAMFTLAPAARADEVGSRVRVPASTRDVVRVQILGLNDFHGRLSPGLKVEGRPAGGAAVLAAYLREEQASFSGSTFIVHAGDAVGATPPESALLQDEPTIAFLNALGNAGCQPGRPRPSCNMVGTVGNHELDEGYRELLRLVQGGNHAKGPFLSPQYAGAAFPYVSANVLVEATKKPLLAPYVVKKVQGISIAFLGAVLEDARHVITPEGVSGLTFVDEADAINGHVRALQKQGVEVFVVLIHQGGHQKSYDGPTRPDASVPEAEIRDVVSRLDGAVDVVVSGHAHSFSNALLANAAGKPTLVTQAFASGTAYGDIELVIDRKSRDVVMKTASIEATFADAGPGLTPAGDIAALVAAAQKRVAPLVERQVGESKLRVVREPNEAGESALGDLIADAQRAAVSADIGLMNLGGIRSDLEAGPVTWGELFTVQPFANDIVRMELSGAELLALLEQQWSDGESRILQISGMRVTWDPAKKPGQRVVDVRVGDAPLARERTYSVAVNSFLAPGGDNFSVLARGKNRSVGPVDLEALTRYVEASPRPFTRVTDGRINKLSRK